MRFYILSDFHLSVSLDKTKAETCIKTLCSEIRKSSDITETVLFIILGDIIDKGSELSIGPAEFCLTLILDELRDYSVKFEFIPGNHDIEGKSKSLNLFDQLIEKYGSKHAFEKESTYSCEYDGVNFIFSDSNLSRNYAAPGQLDLTAIRAEVKRGVCNILFCHHALSHGQGDSHDAIENGAAVLAELNDLNISFLFHGHMHYSDITIPDKGIVEIGVGALLGDVSWKDWAFNQFSVGYIQNGTLVCVERWVYVSDGFDHFIPEDIYPRRRSFVDPNSIGKIDYKLVDNYFPRTLSDYESVNRSPFAGLFGKTNKISLRNITLRYNKVLILCDAGMGKSIELLNLAYELCKTFHTYLFSLRNYTGKDIYDLLPDSYKQLPSHQMLLLFDGYDELDKESRDIFKRNLRIFIEDFPAARIVISSRSNFCGNEDSNESKTFSGFKIFILNKLSTEEVKIYLESRNVDVNDFWNTALAKHVSELMFNPFYLTRLTEFYLGRNSLPSKKYLMDELVADTFDVDELKFSCDLGDHYIELISILERLAFAMQLMHKWSFEDREEYQRLFQHRERELIKKSGLLKREGTSWYFLHNNFREYLAARYLSKLPQDKALSIFYDMDISQVKPSWINTLGYLTGFELDWDLFDWLVENSPSALVKFEPDRLSSKQRVDVFKRLFEKYESLHLLFKDDLCDEAELAYFTNSREILIFLIDRINVPKHYYSQYTALKILLHYPSLFDKENVVRDCLVHCCEKYPETPKEICRLALLTLCHHKLQTPETTKRLMSYLGESTEDYIRLGFYEYLLETGVHNIYVKYFLDGLKIIKDNSKALRIGNEIYELRRGLKSMNTMKSVSYTLDWLAHEEYLDLYNFNEILEALIDSAITLYQSGKKEIYNTVFLFYINSVEKMERQASHTAIKFFLNTGTIATAVLTATTSVGDKLYRISDLINADKAAIEYLKIAYINEQLECHETFHQIVIQFVDNEFQYKEYSALIKDIDGVDLPEYKPLINYETHHNQTLQEYINILFDTDRKTQLLDELLNIINGPKTTTKQLFDIELNLEYDSVLDLFRYDIYHYSDDILVSDFLKKADLDEFIIRSVARILVENNNIAFSSIQKEILYSIIGKQLEIRNFDNCVIYEGESMCIKSLIPELLTLILCLGYRLTDKLVLKLTELPAYLFDRNNDAVKYIYIRKRVPINMLKKRLIENVSTGKVKNVVLRDHIEFFDSCKDPSLAEYALNICKEKDTYLRYVALQYIYNTLGVEYLVEEILPIADGNFLVEINGLCKDIPKDELKEAMEREYGIAPSIQLQAHLITLGSKIAVEDYVSKVSIAKCPPEKNGADLDGPTEAIGTIRDPSFLPLLEKLIIVVFDPQFADSAWRTLRDSLSKALVNCGINAYDETVRLLMKYCPSADENEANYRFCNYTIEEIEHARKISFDTAKSFLETKKILQELNNYF